MGVKKSKPEVSRKQEKEENIRRVDYKADAGDKKTLRANIDRRCNPLVIYRL